MESELLSKEHKRLSGGMQNLRCWCLIFTHGLSLQAANRRVEPPVHHKGAGDAEEDGGAQGPPRLGLHSFNLLVANVMLRSYLHLHALNC